MDFPDLDESLSHQINPPDTHDAFFSKHDDWQNNACVNWSNGCDIYTEGYKQAADILVMQVIETSSKQVTLVYPIMFLYRQYIELELKEIIRMANKLLYSEQKPEHNHLIDKLWEKSYALLIKVFKNESTDDLKNITHLIKEFSSVDPISTAFRYPTDKSGKPSLPEDITLINLRNVKEVMEKMHCVLSGISIQLDEYLQIKYELEKGYS